MIKLKKGNILEADAEALVNTVNCVGVMGRGIALQFRKAYPDNFSQYEKLCNKGELQPGTLFVYETGHLTNPRYIINFPTKKHWRGKSRLEYIDSGLEELVQEVRKLSLRSIAIPPLGCGLGGLHWEVVKPRIENALASLPELKVFLFEPHDAVQPEIVSAKTKIPNMTAGRAALLGLMDRYLSAFMDPFVSLLEIHKLMYFMQARGEPLKLRYQKGIYGPYADNLRHVLSAIEGHHIKGFLDPEDRPDKQIELLPEVAPKAMAYLDGLPDTRSRFDQVVDLVKGFETPFGMELLSTVHWVVTQDAATTVEETVQTTHAWNDRKRMFERRHIETAWDVLQSKGWFNAA